MKLRMLSLGAGVQSTTLALMAAAGEFPGEPLDGAIFADTQWEPADVYRHLAWLTPLLPFPVHVVSAGDIRAGILARRNTTGGRYAAIPWFVQNPDGSAGMGRRQCTSEYKLTPIMHKLRDLLGVGRRGRVAKGSVEQWIGISRDEASRMKPARQQWITNRWPLVERLMSRDDCLRWLAARGYPTPPKSACIGCPFHNHQAWQTMQAEAPVEFADAVAVDAALRQGEARGMRGQEFMHSARLPLIEAVALKARPYEPNLFENECEGMCGV
jgi:hypothetical protein